MAKQEICTRFGNPLRIIWWNWWPGTSIILKWPSGEVTIDHTMPDYDWTMSAPSYTFYSSDPNEHYRYWLETNVGRQGWDWDWRISPVHSMWIGNVPREVNDALEIKFRKGKEKWATLMSLKWG